MCEALIGESLYHVIPDAHESYKVVGVLGTGHYGVILKAINLKTNKFVACKVINRLALNENGEIKRFESELRICERLDHPNVIKIIEILYTNNLIYLVMEYCPNGDLYTYISSKEKLEEYEIIGFSRKILNAIEYLHSRGISHRDIKPENIVLDEDMEPKLIDFGLCTDCHGLSFKTRCGSPFYIAPEVITSPKYSAMAADMWSFGITLYLMCTRKLPWKEPNELKILQSIKAGNIEFDFKDCGPFAPILELALDADPLKRATAKTLLEMPLMKTRPTQPILPILNISPDHQRGSTYSHSTCKRKIISVRSAQSPGKQSSFCMSRNFLRMKPLLKA